MNIGQIARNQQMLYRIANKTGSISNSSKPAAFSSSKLSDYSGLLNGWGVGSAVKDDGDNFFSSPEALQGTVRQIAKRVYDASFSPDAMAENNGANFTQGVDQNLQAIQKQLGAKLEAQQQLCQPDQTALSGSFEELQALADSLVSRLQTVSLPEETTKGIQELALMDAKNSAGTQENGEANTSALSQKDRLSLIQGEVQKFAPSKRAAAFNTINQLWQSETDRIGAYIKEKDPDWIAWGDKFDVGILDDYKAGINLWV